MRNIKAEVIGFTMERYPIREHGFRSGVKKITKEWTLQDDFTFMPEGAHDFLIDVFNHFNVDYSTFDGRNYVEYEYPFWQKKPSPVPVIKPLTIEMIIESVKAGRWLYA